MSYKKVYVYNGEEKLRPFRLTVNGDASGSYWLVEDEDLGTLQAVTKDGVWRPVNRTSVDCLLYKFCTEVVEVGSLVPGCSDADLAMDVGL